MKSKYSIKDLERLSGIKAHTIRIWEQRYNIIEPKRTETNIRYYCDEDLRRILNVSYLVLEGEKISRVAIMPDGELNNKVKEHAIKNCTYTAELNALKLAMYAYDEIAFNQIINASFKRHGEEVTFSEVLGSFISELGILWQTNTVNITHEHFVSNLIKQKLYTAIDNCNREPDAQAETFLLYLPANELHEIGLLYLALALKKKGARTIFMGQNTPAEYLKEVYNKTNFKYAISVFTTYPNASEIENYFEEVKRTMNGVPVKYLFCGAQLAEIMKKDVAIPNVSLYKNVLELLKNLPT